MDTVFDITGLDLDMFIDDLSLNGSGYLLEVSTDGVEDNVLIEGGAFDDKLIFAEIDYGDLDRVNPEPNLDLFDMHIVKLTGSNNSELLVYADGRNFFTHTEFNEETEIFGNKEELKLSVKDWIDINGKRDVEIHIYDPDEYNGGFL